MSKYWLICQERTANLKHVFFSSRKCVNNVKRQHMAQAVRTNHTPMGSGKGTQVKARLKGRFQESLPAPTAAQPTASS